MATATKTSTKSIRPKTKKATVEVVQEEQIHEADITPSKVKKPLEIDEPEVVGGIEEKLEEDPLIGATEDEESSEEASLDGEELNPFGDRWEE